MNPFWPVSVNWMLVAEPPLATVELSVPVPVLLQTQVALCEQVISWTAVAGQKSSTSKVCGEPAEVPPAGKNVGPLEVP